MNTSKAALNIVDPIGPMTQDGYANRLLQRALAQTSITALYEPPSFVDWCDIQRNVIGYGPVVLDVTPC